MRILTFLLILASFQLLNAEEITIDEPLEVDLGIRGAVELRFASEVNVYYQIQISEDLSEWDNEGYSIKGTGGDMTTLVSSRNLSKAFYRLRNDGDPRNIAPSSVLPGTIQLFAGTTAPAGWAICDGSSLSRIDYSDLFTTISTTYGSDSATTFKIPDLRGRVVMGAGQGANLSNRTLGQKSGSETHQLTEDELPEHSHYYYDVVHPDPFGPDDPVSSIYFEESSTPDPRGAKTVLRQTQNAGNDVPFNIVQPSIVLNYIIKL